MYVISVIFKTKSFTFFCFFFKYKIIFDHSDVRIVSIAVVTKVSEQHKKVYLQHFGDKGQIQCTLDKIRKLYCPESWDQNNKIK